MHIEALAKNGWERVADEQAAAFIVMDRGQQLGAFDTRDAARAFVTATRAAWRTGKPAAALYDHTFEIAFSLSSHTEDGSDVTPAMFRAALMQRIADLDAADEWNEVLGVPVETIDVSEITCASP